MNASFWTADMTVSAEAHDHVEQFVPARPSLPSFTK